MLHKHHRCIHIFIQKRHHALQRFRPARRTGQRNQLAAAAGNLLMRQRTDWRYRSRSCFCCHRGRTWSAKRCEPGPRLGQHWVQKRNQIVAELHAFSLYNIFRLCQKINSAMLHRLYRNGCIILCQWAYNDYRSTNILFLQFFQKLQAIHLWHINVQKYSVITAALDFLICFQSIPACVCCLILITCINYITDGSSHECRVIYN